MTPHRIALLLSFASAAAAAATPAGPASTPSEPASDSARMERFTHRQDVPAQFTLLKAQGSIGRDGAIGDDFPVQLRFTGDTTRLDCHLHLPKANQVVKPGETAVVVVKCAQPHRVDDKGMGFEAFENGRKIGEGTIRP